MQLPLHVKKKKYHIIINNNFSDKSAKKNVKYILNKF